MFEHKSFCGLNILLVSFGFGRLERKKKKSFVIAATMFLFLNFHNTYHVSNKMIELLKLIDCRNGNLISLLRLTLLIVFSLLCFVLFYWIFFFVAVKCLCRNFCLIAMCQPISQTLPALSCNHLNYLCCWSCCSTNRIQHIFNLFISNHISVQICYFVMDHH